MAKSKVVITRGICDQEYHFILEVKGAESRVSAVLYGDEWEVHEYGDSKRLMVFYDGQFTGAIYGSFEIVKRV